ncbi:efflux RND transporter permease subunit [Anaeromyxobacter oryzisoli]|uniref:efflux RND transporter permease subunit n=1 Tax=Anaeromyxobacter oryzisoli TaxID=2925408 RepID=UPI001F56BEA1|nr:MMPL family transporter [Anaeromyxobacter sp. SG63]
MAPPRTLGLFRRIVALRVPILAAAAIATCAAAILAARIPSESAIDRLLVPSDPDYVATRAFHEVFPEGQFVLLLLEADDPYAPPVLGELERVEDALRKVEGVTPTSALDVYRRSRPQDVLDAPGAAAFRKFVAGVDVFRRQGLAGDRFISIAIDLQAATDAERDAALAGIDDAVARARTGAARAVRKVGAPYVESWIERQTGEASGRYFPVFGLLVIVLVLFLYRSWRALLAILLSLGAAVALAVAAGELLGFSFTIVSALVPLTVMVTALASLVYVHSRFVDQPEGVDVDTHQLHALANKFLPVTASTVAASLGFAALAVSPIRPIREMGIWTAVGLVLSWVVVFTVFPSLQRVLRTPTGRSVAIRTRVYDAVAGALPGFTYRWRWPLLVGALALAAGGLVALTGIPGRLAPMRIGLDQLDYVDRDLAIHRDLVFFQQNVAGLDVARVWIRTPPGNVTDPEVLRGVEQLTRAVEGLPRVNAVIGPTTFLRMRRALAGQDPALPEDPAAFARASSDVEQLLLTEPELRGFIDVGSLANAQLMVTFDAKDQAAYHALADGIRAAWDRIAAADPALQGASMQVVGEALLQAKVGGSLVPTLTESFALTAGLIVIAFLFVFRSASARLLAMIPSVFAILVTFLGMRLFGAGLNVATILIATTVLGTTENDQIHFFHHLHEGEGPAGLDGELRHTLRVAGRAILFATLINASGFLGLALSSFPPIRQFGVITAGAFALAMVADFTALPAALWILRGERPAGAGDRRPS